MFYYNKYVVFGLYSVNYIAENPLYSSPLDIIPCVFSSDFYWLNGEITTSEIVNRGEEDYIIYITDNLGNKLADGAQPISTNYIKFASNYPTLVANDINNVFFDIGGNAKTLLIGDLIKNYNDQYFFDFDEFGTITKIGLYKSALSGECLDKAGRYFRAVLNLFDESFNELLDENGEELFS